MAMLFPAPIWGWIYCKCVSAVCSAVQQIVVWRADFRPATVGGGYSPPALYDQTMTNRLGEFIPASGFRVMPPLACKGRVGIRGRQFDTIKARANSQKPKIGLYEFARACTDHWCLLHPSPTPPLQAREGMRSVTLVCTIHRNTHAHYLAGMAAAPTGESGVRQLPGCVTKLAAGPARRVAQRFHKPVGRYGMILLFFK